MNRSASKRVRLERILVIDDDASVAHIVNILLEQSGYRVTLAPTAKEGLEKFSSEAFDLVVTDLKLPDLSGLEIIRQIKVVDASVPIIMMTSFSSIDSAVQALRSGACDYIIKPFNNDEFVFSVDRAIYERRILRENTLLKRNLNKNYSVKKIIGDSNEIKRVLNLIEKVAQSDAHVLIHGESGTGKELVAHAIHEASPRSAGPFVPVNCGALPGDLMESELFGHTKGAFSGATVATEGLIREANSGTLFLDEVSELAINLQVKLLRVLQEKQVRPVGSTQFYPTNVRFLAASNRDLKNEVAQGRFRADLFYRLNVIDIFVPPLRQRREDIEILARHFIQIYSRQLNKTINAISPEMCQHFREYSWPGNVRELENYIERNIILAETDTLTDSQDTHNNGAAITFSEESIEGILNVEEYIREFVRRYQNRYKEVELAAMLGIGRKALWVRRNRWNLFREESREKKPA
jgi:DNA-binding NtrC family response regulator